MAKKKKKKDVKAKLDAADYKHYRDTEKFAGMVDKIYQQAIADLSMLAAKVDALPDKPFSFSQNKAIEDEVNSTIERLSGRITAIVEKGSRMEWTAACVKSEQFIGQIMNVSKLTKGTLQSYQDRNLEALAAFTQREVDGMNLSRRVWKHVAPLKDEVEVAVDATKYYKNGINSQKTLTKVERAIGTGMSAAELSREVRSCLLEPNKLFRRVRDKYGNLHLSKAAKLYHPGQGVYRSSYKNAMRLTRSEINMAYRQSDHLRWQQLDFVTGMKIELSNNHTCLSPKTGKPAPFTDICDTLAGNYPKDFKFVGWHPQCRCHATPILRPLDDIGEGVADKDGNWHSLPSSSEVKDTPDAFKKYMRDNEERISRWKSTPYYIKDNPQWVDKALHPEKYKVSALVLDQDTQKRLADFEIYGFNHQGSRKFNAALANAKEAILKGQQQAFDDAMAEMEAIMKKNEGSTASKAAKRAAAKIDPIAEAKKKMLADDLATFSEAQRANIVALEAAIKQKKGLRMSYEEADTGRENPNYKKGKQYKVNCQTCTVIHELRRRGFNVEAVGNDHGSVWKIYKKNGVGSSAQGYRIGKWLKEDGTPAKPYYAHQWIGKKGYKSMTKDRVKEFFNEVAPNDGRYEIYVDWKGGSAHVFCAERKDGKWTFFDPQSGKKDVLDKYIDSAKLKSFGIIRTDNKLVEVRLAETFIAKGELPIVVQTKTRAEIIKENAEKRHAARSQQKIDDIKKFAAEHAEKTRKAYDEIMQNVNDGKKFRDIDVTKQVDMMTANVGVKMKSGKMAGLSLEKQLAEAKAMKNRMNELVNEANKLRDIIPDAVDLLGTYKIEELKDNYNIITKQFKYVDSLTLEDRPFWLSLEIKNAQNAIQKKAYEEKLKKVNIEIKVKVLTPKVNEILDIAKVTDISYFKDLALKAEQSLSIKDIAEAEKALSIAESMKDAIKRYDILSKYEYGKKGKGSTAIRTNLEDAKRLLNEGKVKEAIAEIVKGEERRITNEASNAAKAAAREQKRLEEEAKRLAEANKAKQRKPIKDCTLKELKEIYGDKLPRTIEQIDDAVAAFTRVSSGLLKDHEQIEEWMKELIDNSDYGMAIKHKLLESVLNKGFLNTFQTGTSGGYNGSSATTGLIEKSHSRLVAAHTMFDPAQKNKISGRSFTGKQLERKEYEKYGHLLLRDKAESIDKQSVWYGDVQIRFRKDKVIPTFTYDDSLCLHYQPSLASDPKVQSFDRSFDSAKKSDFKDVLSLRRLGHSSYIELQYHGDLGVDCIESITFESNPIKSNLCKKEVLEGFARQGAKIFYVDNGKVIQMSFETKEEMRKRILAAADERHRKRDLLLSKKNSSAEKEIAKLLETRAQEQIKAKEEAEKVFEGIFSIANKDIDPNILKSKLDSGNYLGARKEARRVTKLNDEFKAREMSISDLIPDAKALHQKFTMEELEGAHTAIKSKIADLERRSGGDILKFEKKLIFEVGYIEDPSHRKHSTWSIARDAYKRKAIEVRRKIDINDAEKKVAELRSFGKVSKEFEKILDEAHSFLESGNLEKAREIIEKAVEIKEGVSKKIKSVFERITFDDDAFSEHKKNAVNLIKGRSAQDGFNKADKMMSPYAEDLWARMTEEERMVAYMYTYGSKYINEPLYSRYLGVKYSPDGKRRISEDDINTLTGIIAKAKPLEKEMWVQHSQDTGAFEAIFGKNLRSMSDLTELVGKEGVNNIFMSTSCAEKSLFVAKPPKDRGLDVVMNIYLPKGTKGMYCEPFAHWGDGKKPYGAEKDRYGTDGLKWNGKSRLDDGIDAGDQVEFVLQRGSKLKITKAEFKNGKWYIDCELREQTELEKFVSKY